MIDQEYELLTDISTLAADNCPSPAAIALRAEYEEYYYGSTFLLATFETIEDFRETFQTEHLSSLCRITTDHLKALYEAGKACIYAAIKQDQGGLRMIQFRREDAFLVAEEGDCCVVVPDRFSEPHTWKEFSDIYMSNSLRVEAEKKGGYLYQWPGFLTQAQLCFHIADSHKSGPGVQVSRTLSTTLQGRQITRVVSFEGGFKSFLDAFEVKSMRKLEKISVSDVTRLYEEGLAHIEAVGKTGNKTWSLEFLKEGNATLVTGENGYQKRIWNFDDSELAFFNEVNSYLRSES